MKLFGTVLLILICFIDAFAQTPCSDGIAGDYPCANIDLMGQLTPAELLAEEHNGILLNDIWGWTDPQTSKEYALVGMANGTSFVDVTDPTNPIMLGILREHHEVSGRSRVLHDGAKSIWRDIKVYNNHAFIVSEDLGHGMQVMDLTRLRDVTDPPVEFPEDANYQEISNAHNIVINEETGYAYAVGATNGANCGDGGLHVIDISDPKNPTYAACFDDEGYTHDTQCVIYQGPDTDYQGQEICFNSNEDFFAIVNVEDKANIHLLAKEFYNGVYYAHQGWLTEDHRFFLSNDELDERETGNNTKTFVWNVEDLDNPLLIGVYEHRTQAIDHNLYIKDQMAYESNYTSGLRIMDLTNVATGEIREAGFFDTYPVSETNSFFGTWSNYPFFASGNIIVSDIRNGLFILKPNFTAPYLVKQDGDIEGCEEDHFDIGVEIGGMDLGFQWQVDEGSGFEDIADLVKYKNTNSDSLRIESVEAFQNGYQFRCKITSGGQEIFTDPIQLTINEEPVANFEYTQDGQNINFLNLSEHATSYAWDFGDGSATSDLESPSHEYQSSNEFVITLEATNDCATHSFQTTINVVLDLGNTSNLLTIYPNPLSSASNLIVPLKESGRYKIVDGQGRTVLSGSLSINDQQISLSGLNPGVYAIQVSAERGISKQAKFIVR